MDMRSLHGRRAMPWLVDHGHRWVTVEDGHRQLCALGELNDKRPRHTATRLADQSSRGGTYGGDGRVIQLRALSFLGHP